MIELFFENSNKTLDRDHAPTEGVARVRGFEVVRWPW